MKNESTKFLHQHLICLFLTLEEDCDFGVLEKEIDCFLNELHSNKTINFDLTKAEVFIKQKRLEFEKSIKKSEPKTERNDLMTTSMNNLSVGSAQEDGLQRDDQISKSKNSFIGNILEIFKN